MEEAISLAPEQWFAAFQPIWDDCGRPMADATKPRGGGERGRADMHLHTLYSDGTMEVQALLDHVEQRTELDLVAVTDHERIDGALRVQELHAAGDYHFGLVVGEEITTRRGHLLALFLTERIPALRPAGGDDRTGPRPGRDRDRPAPDGAADPQPRPPQPDSPAPRPDQRHRLDAIEMLNPSVAGRARRPHRHALNQADGARAVGNSDAHVLEHIGTGWTWFPAPAPRTTARAIAERTTEAEGEYWTHWHNVSVYGRQLVAKARHVRHTLRPTGEWR
jgi:predicted metal-dependent phosphoesterase TrpH